MYLIFVASLIMYNIMKRNLLYLTPFVKVSLAASEDEDSLVILEDIENKTGYLMLHVFNLWKNYHDKILKKHHALSYLQYVVLVNLYRLSEQRNEPITQTLVAKYTNVGLMTLFKIIKKLEAKKYISRTTHPTDARAKAICLTPKGMELTSRVVQTIATAEHRFFKVLGEHTDDFNKYLHLLLRMDE